MKSRRNSTAVSIMPFWTNRMSNDLCRSRTANGPILAACALNENPHLAQGEVQFAGGCPYGPVNQPRDDLAVAVDVEFLPT